MKRAFTRIFALVTLGFFLIPASFAATHNHSATKRALAQELCELLNVPEMLEQSMMLSFPQELKANLQQQGLTLTEAQLVKVTNSFRTFVKDKKIDSELKDGVIDLYLNEFTERELQVSVAFYKTPEGQSMIKRMPVLMAKGAQVGHSVMQKHDPELTAHFEKVFEEIYS